MTARLDFLKMHGLGNDFVVIDRRAAPQPLGHDALRHLADRRFGIGCDQVILLDAAADADLAMTIHNPDGSAAEACGNATRCIARLIMDETGAAHATIRTIAGLRHAEDAGQGLVRVDMGTPGTDWRDIPLREPCDTLNAPLAFHGLLEPVATSMGNPHLTYIVPQAETVPLAHLAPHIQANPLLPHSANIGLAEVTAPDRIRLRVYERGAGLTLACGSGACAALVACARRGVSGRRATLVLDGGALLIEWRADDHVLMSGPATLSYRGVIDLPERLAPQRRLRLINWPAARCAT